MSYKVIRPATHEDWLAERSKGIGSSEAGTIMGVNKFDTAYRLWRRKTGQDGPVQMNEAMELGHHMEDAVATMFAAHTGSVIQKSSKGDWIAVDSRRDHLRVSPDRIYFHPGEPERFSARIPGILSQTPGMEGPNGPSVPFNIYKHHERTK